MTIKECIDIVDNIKPNQYSVGDKVRWLSFIDSTIINDVLKTHEGYDGRYDEFEGYSEEKTSVALVVPSPYDRLYTAYLKMKIDGENGETARYNNSAAEFNAYLMEYRKHYNKTHLPLDPTRVQKPTPKKQVGISEAEYENLKRELYYLLSEDFAKVTSHDKLYDIVTEYAMNNVEMLKGKDGYTPLKGVDYFDGEKGDKGDDYILTETDKGEIANDVTKLIQTKDGTIVSQNADFAEVAEWGDGNPNNEDRTGYFVCADVPVNGIIMRKATSTDDVKGVSILAPAFAGNYTKDKLDSNGNLLPKYSYVAILGFVPVVDNGTCEVGGRCMPDDNGCAVPSSNNMGYQVVNRIDADRVLIIIEPNGDMVQRIKTRVNELQEDIDNLAPDQTYNPESENAQSGKAVAEALANISEGNYELIETIEVTKDMAISRIQEPNGTPYNFKRVRICVETTATDFALARFSFKSASNVGITHHDFSAFSNSTQTKRSWCEIYSNCGMWANRQISWTQYNGYMPTQENAQDFSVSTKQAPTISSISTTTKVTAGTTVKIWGVRA